jgi:uncharacterized protein (DUF2141 family)
MNATNILWLISEIILTSFSWINNNPTPVSQLQNRNGIDLIISNIRNKTGYIQINVFDSETGYPGKAQIKFTLSKDTIVSGRLRIFIPLLKPGSFGITVLDDENKNEKMDFVFGIKPREGFGFSNNPRVPGRKPPSFNDTRINYSGGINEVVIYMKYI